MKSPFLQPLVKDQLTLYVFVSVLFAVGAVFGAIMVHALTLEQQQDLAGEIEHFVRLLHAGMNPDAVQSFWDRVWFHSKWILLLWLLGISVAGLPIILVLDFLKGMLIGFSFGLLVSQHAWEGVAFALVSIAPPNLIILPALLITSVSGLSFSIYMVKNRILQRSGSLWQPFISHSSVAIVMLAVMWGAAWFEAYVSPELMTWASTILLEAGS